MASDNLLRMCSACKKININGKWVGEEYPDYEVQVKSHNITHGSCPDCTKEEYKKWDLLKEVYKKYDSIKKEN